MTDVMIDPTLPFIDLHRHIDGSVRLETIVDLAKRHGIKLPAHEHRGLASARPNYRAAAGSHGLYRQNVVG